MKKILLLCFTAIFMWSCYAPDQHGYFSRKGESQLELRQIQTRFFDTDDKKKMMENAIETLQDLGFVLDNASYGFGVVSATKLSGYTLKTTVLVMPRNGGGITVRADMRFNGQPVDAPGPYQDFFDALSKAVFLRAQLDE